MNFLQKLKSVFQSKGKIDPDMKKFLIVGLGNTGDKYKDTRHNIGFSILDKLAEKEQITFETKKLGDVARFNYKGRTFILLKPNTFMNLSGKAVKYWQTIENIPLENIFVITDDLNLPFGTIRIKGQGSAGGHNGLTHINEVLQTQNYARLRFGIGNEYNKGGQIDHVLGTWDSNEKEHLNERIEKSTKAITSFALAGLANTMNTFNGK
jgi:PTH1 family peptidyl-tRNA hydrolase